MSGCIRLRASYDASADMYFHPVPIRHRLGGLSTVAITLWSAAGFAAVSAFAEWQLLSAAEHKWWLAGVLGVIWLSWVIYNVIAAPARQVVPRIYNVRIEARHPTHGQVEALVDVEAANKDSFPSAVQALTGTLAFTDVNGTAVNCLVEHLEIGRAYILGVLEPQREIDA